MSRNPSLFIRNRQPRNGHLPYNKNRQTLLLIADEALLSHLVSLLTANHFPLYATADLRVAQAILSIAPIDLVLLHASPELSYGGWEAYEHLHRITAKPVLAIANLTTAHFQQPSPPLSPPKTNADVANYLNLVDFLCQTLA